MHLGERVVNGMQSTREIPRSSSCGKSSCFVFSIFHGLRNVRENCSGELHRLGRAVQVSECAVLCGALNGCCLYQANPCGRSQAHCTFQAYLRSLQGRGGQLMCLSRIRVRACIRVRASMCTNACLHVC